MKRDYLYLALILFIILAWWFYGRPEPVNDRNKELEAKALLYQLERDQLRVWVDSLVALGDSAKLTIPTNQTIINQNETTYKLRAADIVGMPLDGQIKHFAGWVSKADSLRK